MTGGAAPVAPRLCREDGCCLPIRARGRCSKHYQRWLAANPGLRTQVQMQRAILDAMPGRPHQICDEAGLEIQSVLRHLKRMQDEKLVHIEKFDPPDVTGYKFEPVWKAGPGPNAKLTEKMKIEYRRARQRRARRRRDASKFRWLAPLALAA